MIAETIIIKDVNKKPAKSPSIKSLLIFNPLFSNCFQQFCFAIAQQHVYLIVKCLLVNFLFNNS